MLLISFRLVPLACIALGLVSSACGSEAEAPADAQSDEAQIEAVVESFNQAAEDLDGAILCEHVLAPSLVGGKCAERIDKAMTESPENWTPIDSVTKIEVQGSSASASGEQEGEPIELTFVRENDHWWMQVFD